APPKEVLTRGNVTDLLNGLQGLLHEAARQGTAIHEVERVICPEALRIGRPCRGHLLASRGNGEPGETLGGDGQEYRRLPALHPRRYRSSFGAFGWERVGYGSREGPRTDFVPLDPRLPLPRGSFPYAWQDCEQPLCLEQAFGQAASTVGRI